MIAVIIILSILLIFALTAIWALWKAILYLEPQVGFDLKEYFNENIIDEFPCTLIFTAYKDENYGKIVDFSKYEEYGIVGITEYMPQTDEEFTAIVPNQKIVLLKNGEYEWDLRPYL